MTTHTPQAHARLSPSGSKGWFKCPGKLVLEAGFPDKPNEYSDDGTACHDVAAHILRFGGTADEHVGRWIVVSHPGEPERKVAFDEDMADMVQGYVGYVRSKAGAGTRLLVESRVSFSHFIATEDQFGTTDATIVNLPQHELDVTDAKFGRIPVSPDGNSQLMIYALGTLAALYEEAMQAQAAAAAQADAEPATTEGEDDDLAG